MSAWESSDVPAGEFSVKAKTLDTVEYYYNREIYDCQADVFQIRARDELCWGGYVVIGVSVALILIIAIILGVS